MLGVRHAAHETLEIFGAPLEHLHAQRSDGGREILHAHLVSKLAHLQNIIQRQLGIASCIIFERLRVRFLHEIHSRYAGRHHAVLIHHIRHC